MPISIEPTPVPLRVDETGTIRVGDSRVLVDLVVERHRRGETPEQISEAFPTVALPDVYLVIGYYLRHHGVMDEYLAARARNGDDLRRTVEATFPVSDLRARVAKRRTERGRAQRAAIGSG